MKPSDSAVSANDSSSSPSDQPRRGFFAKVAALALGALAYAAPVVAGLCAFLNPFRQKCRVGELRHLAALDSLDGTPRKFPVIADRTDAWNRFPDEPIGAVFLRRTDDDQVEAIHVVCPHAGCSIQYEAAAGEFLCPCHMARFDVTGKRLDVATNASPRDLDTLETEIRNGTEVWVRFQNFRSGTPNKIAEA